MLNKLTQIENEMDECLMSVDAADDAVAEAGSSLRRTISDNFRCSSPGDEDCRTIVATSRSDQTLSLRCMWADVSDLPNRQSFRWTFAPISALTSQG